MGCSRASSLRIFVLLLAVLIGAYLLLPGALGGDVGAVDLLQYWSGAKLLLDGANPYDPIVLKQLQLGTWTGGPLELPVVLWNPPVVFLVILPLALFSFQSAVIVWMIGVLLIVLGAILLLGREHKLGRRHLTVGLVFLLTFPPIYLLLFYGQISHILLLGFVAFIWFVRSDQNDLTNRFLGGLGLSLTLIKPHLLFLVYLLILIDSVRERRWNTLLGLCVGTAFLALMPTIINGEIYSYYLAKAKVPPIEWVTPTLGSWLQSLSGQHSVVVRFIPTVVAGVIFCVLGIFFRSSLQLHQVAAFSLACSPYGWVYDQLLLLPGIVCLFGLLPNLSPARQYQIVGILLLANFTNVVIPMDWGQEFFVWYPLLCGVLFSKYLVRDGLEPSPAFGD